jgi:hypothetical protein
VAVAESMTRRGITKAQEPSTVSMIELTNVLCGRRSKVRAVERPDPNSCWLLVTVFSSHARL